MVDSIIRVLSKARLVAPPAPVSGPPRPPNVGIFGAGPRKAFRKKNYYTPVDETWRPLNGSRYYRSKGRCLNNTELNYCRCSK